jgi:hypothetical protein
MVWVMRRAQLSLLSLALLLGPLACTLGDDSSCYEEGSCDSYPGYDPYYDSGATPPSTTPSCDEELVVAVATPSDAGDCQMTFSGSSSYSGYEAIYYFPSAPDGGAAACEALEGPTVERCERRLDTLVFSTSRASDIAYLRDALGMSSGDTNVGVSVACARSTTPITRSFQIRCASAGSGDAGVRVNDAGDAGTSDAADAASADPDAAATPEAGCGP